MALRVWSLLTLGEAQTLTSLPDAMADAAADVELLLNQILACPKSDQESLFKAMRYASLNGGKRLRPFLTIESARLFGAPDKYSLRVGTAVELIHCYSLIHDDLPAMDDDDIRHNQPSSHMVFGEAQAILAGDALQALAFKVISSDELLDSDVKVSLLNLLAISIKARVSLGKQEPP